MIMLNHWLTDIPKRLLALLATQPRTDAEAIGISILPTLAPADGHNAIGIEQQFTVDQQSAVPRGMAVGHWFRPILFKGPNGKTGTIATVYLTGPNVEGDAHARYGLFSEWGAGPTRLDDPVAMGGPEIVRQLTVRGDIAVLGAVGDQSAEVVFCMGQQGGPSAFVRCEQRDDAPSPAGDLVFGTRTNEGGGATREVLRITSEGKVLIHGKEIG